MPRHNDVVTRNRGLEVLPGTQMQALGPGVRLVWLEAQGSSATPSSPLTSEIVGARLGAITRQVRFMDISGSGCVSAGELRNFLWNLHLSDDDFKAVLHRFSPPTSKSGQSYLDTEDVMFLLGRSHIINRTNVPVDALIYEAVVSILGRRTTAHIDRDLSHDETLGYSSTCKKHCCSYTTSTTLQIATIAGAIVWLICTLLGSNSEIGIAGIVTAVVCYIVYLIHICAGVGLTRAFHNTILGIEAVCVAMEQPCYENPEYHWRVQCYHYETRHYTETETDANGNKRTVHKTRQERVNTHSAHASGIIPSQDFSPAFMPDTRAQQTQIDTLLHLDFTYSNYLYEYENFCNYHRRDVHQDKSRSEVVPSRMTSCLAVWVGHSRPWWMSPWAYWLSNFFLLSCCFRMHMQANLGSQEYTYVKKCYSIASRVPRYGDAIGAGMFAGAATAAAVMTAAAVLR